MKHKGDEDNDRVRILGERDRDCVDEDWNKNTTSGACHNHTNNSIGEWSFTADFIEHFAAWRANE